jgi:hypothetical protein
LRFDTKFEQYLRAKQKTAQRGTVRIENPLPGGATRLKADVAMRHVQRGAAEWSKDGKSIWFHTAAVDRVMRSFDAYRADREVHRTMADDKAMKGLPVTNPRDLKAPVKRRHFWSKKAVFTDFRTSPQRTKR